MMSGRSVSRRRLVAAASFALLTLLASAGGQPAHAENAPATLAPPAQTDVDRAQHGFDREGVPLLDIEKVGKVRHPAWTALYALAYAGTEAYEERLKGLEDPAKFQACIRWLESTLVETPGGLWVWRYDFDNTYNDITIRAPWSSAFAQATGIQALVAAWRADGEPGHLDLARKAAKSLLAPLAQGGFLFQRGEDIWFEEIPTPAENPGHILNGHMRALLALRELAEATGDASIRDGYRRGLATLERWLPLYDTGYWLRYDLNPRKHDLLFRFANPYGFPSHAMAVDNITLRDQATGKELVLDVGEAGDAEGGPRIAGLHWGSRETIERRSARRLVPAALEHVPDQLAAPHSYFYLDLPGEWKDNLRSRWYELAIDYFDDGPASITVQHRTIAPGATFRDMRDGDLHLTGARHWRRWIVPLRTTDLGHWVGISYARKHAEYLNKLSTDSAVIARWATRSESYAIAHQFTDESYRIVESEPPTIPIQRPIIPRLSLSQSGVIRQHMASPDSAFDSQGSWIPTSSSGTPGISPYLIALQLLGIPKDSPYTRMLGSGSIHREPARQWFLDSRNQHRLGKSVTYAFDFDNVYNDVSTSAPWTSAFSQAYVLKALTDTYLEDRSDSRIHSLINGVAESFKVDIASGGVASIDNTNNVFFEEVPNSTHVLNAHLISINQLAATGRQLKSEKIREIAQQGVSTLRENLYKFDTGYWLKYDQNPKKKLLLQLDWLEGLQSPLIESVSLQDPSTKTATRVEIGLESAFSGSSRISGLDWLPATKIDGKWARQFQNGYSIRERSVAGGSRHNAFVVVALPSNHNSNTFDLPELELKLRYKDVSRGAFSIGIQSINEGSDLAFAPLRGGAFETIGDNKWKEATVTVRPQDLGWYKGEEYQAYEVAQLQDIANQTNDWYFYQYAERQRDYLRFKKSGKFALGKSNSQSVSATPRLSIHAASQTYNSFGFENAIDGDSSDDYVAGLEGQSSAFVELDLTPPALVDSVRIYWESSDNYARRVRIVAPELNKEAIEEILGVSHDSPPISSLIKIATDVAISRLRLEFDQFSGQNRVLLRQIEIIPKAGHSDDLTFLPVRGDSTSYLDRNDPINPLSIFRIPLTDRVRSLSNDLSSGEDSDHEKIIKFMDYISQFRVGIASDMTPDTAIIERVGACGTFTNTLLGLAAAQGIKGRAVSMLNYPENDGHVVAEFFIDGAWRLYDPTFNAYYVRSGEPTELPMSFSDLRIEFSRNPHNVKRVAKAYRFDIDLFAGKDIFLKANPAGPIGPDRPMFFPLSLSTSAGHLDKSEFGAKNQGADFIGAASTNQNQRWTFRNLKDGARYAFVLEPDRLGGDIEGKDWSFEVTARAVSPVQFSLGTHTFDFANGHSSSWRIPFSATSHEMTLEIMHPYRGPGFRYMQMKSYRLELIEE